MKSSNFTKHILYSRSETAKEWNQKASQTSIQQAVGSGTQGSTPLSFGLVELNRGCLGIPTLLNPKSLQEETTEHQHLKPSSVLPQHEVWGKLPGRVWSSQAAGRLCVTGQSWLWYTEDVRGAWIDRSAISVLGRLKEPEVQCALWSQSKKKGRRG